MVQRGVQVDTHLDDIRELKVTMECLQKVNIGRGVSRWSKIGIRHPNLPECAQLASKAR